jgi:tetratricopeptide (TPR) repeat protein
MTSMGVQYSKLIEAYQRLRGAGSSQVPDTLAFAQAASAQGQPHLSVAILEPLAKPAVKDAALWQCLGLAYRDEQDLESALRALRRAQKLDPTNATTAFAYAQVLFETARDATAAFATARALSPNNPTLIRTSAAALSAQGQGDAAEALLLDVLAREPQWLDGHKTLAALRVAGGRRDSFDASFKAAVAACPGSLSLRLAWLHLLSTARDWDSARAVLQRALRDFGDQQGLELVRVHIASEAGEVGCDDPHLFDRVKDISDAGLDLCKVRQALRAGDPARAAAIAGAYAGHPAATLFWPYAGLVWRLLGDARAHWLDGTPPPIGQYDLKLTPRERSDLAACLTALHTTQAPFLEQSVHGGTQTTGQLFFRPLPALQAIRAKIQIAVRDYIGALGNLVEGHPLLAPARDGPVQFEGSWSVALKAGGHHSTHTHPKGWISSALYVDVPTPDEIGAPPAGWISFGEAPPELILDLKPYQQIEPKAGKLVLFPSTLWHRTVPFEQGERLTIAFDVKVPTPRISL